MADETAGEARTDFATYGAAKRQDRRWVEQKMKQGQDKAMIKHVFSHHIGMRAEDEQALRERGPCACGYSEQDIVDTMDWSQPTYNSFHYSTAYRDYPRLIKRTPGLDHSAYALMIAGYKSVPEVLTFFATSGATMPFEQLESVLNGRFGGSLWDDPAVREWVFKASKSSKTGMYNRWRRCELIRPIMDALAVAETMMG